jgi:hypothetical protein
MQRFGKPSEGILGVRQSFFTENEESLAVNREQAASYTAQPRRERCKLCDGPLGGEADFVKHEIPYAVCRRCNHLNGLHQDTVAFCEAVYLDTRYDHYYNSEDRAAYQYRVDAVYAPKVRFLADGLREAGEDPARLAYADVGSGSGYFVAALAQAGFDRCRGFEASPSQTAFANRMVAGERCRSIRVADTTAVVGAAEADVVSLIGVLEHLPDPRGVLTALRDNTSVRYVFLCLPLFSLCVYLEMAFPHVFPRHLVCDHTHLFTEKSIEWMEREFGLERKSEWWFGSDMLDLFRQVHVTLAGTPQTSGMADSWTSLMRPLIDPLQLEIDRRRLPSEVHLLLKIAR